MLNHFYKYNNQSLFIAKFHWFSFELYTIIMFIFERYLFWKNYP